jgi:protoporphyrinogen oxidase
MMWRMTAHVAIVGAGITGLVAARELARAGRRVTVVERWPDVGGMASAFDAGGGVMVERYYHHLFESDSAMTRLHDELVPGALEWHRSRVAMFHGGRLWPFVTPLDLLRYGALPPAARIRLGLAVLALQRRTDVERMDGIRALDWLERACGRDTVDAVWRPMLLGKFGEDAVDVPLVWLWSKLVLRRRLRGSGVGRERLGYPRGSFARISHALADDIRRHGGTVLLDREVAAIRRENGGSVLECARPGAYRSAPLTLPAEAGRALAADVVLLTVPTFIARRLTEWPAAVAAGLDAWRYRTAVVLLLELDRPLTDTYWINVADPRVRALGIVEHTNLVPRERYGATYVYVGNYVAPDDPLAALTTDELVAAHRGGLRLVSPHFDERSVRRAWSFREPAAQPIPRTPNRPRLLPYAAAPGLFLANTTQIHPEDRGTNFSVVLGERVAKAVIDASAR